MPYFSVMLSYFPKTSGLIKQIFILSQFLWTEVGI